MMVDVGVDVLKFNSDDQLRKLGDRINILFAGSLEPRKGGALLLRALSRLRERNDRFLCEIVGDGPDQSMLKDKAKNLGLHEQVVFTGRVTHDEMHRVFSEADVFVFPSLRDTSGAIVLEAMAMGIPTVCLDHQGAAIMVSEDCGLKIAPDEPGLITNAFADAIESLMADDKIRSEMGAAARERVTWEYDWSVRVKKTAQDYRELVH